jgi:hypothetical protein
MGFSRDVKRLALILLSHCFETVIKSDEATNRTSRRDHAYYALSIRNKSEAAMFGKIVDLIRGRHYPTERING